MGCPGGEHCGATHEDCRLDEAGRGPVKAAMLARAWPMPGTILAPDERVGVPPHIEAGAHHCRPGGQRADRDRSPGGGDPVSAKAGGVELAKAFSAGGPGG